MARASRALVFFTAFASLAVSGCNTPEAIAKFSTASDTVMTAAVPIFQDLKASCLREENLEQSIGSFKVVDSDSGCTDIGKVTEGAVDAVEILSDYFEAISSLASFGKAKPATDASALATQTAAAVGAGSLAQQALGSMAQYLTLGAAGHYQQRSLAKDVAQAGNYIGVVADALISIVQNNYIEQQLKPEEQKLVTHYKEFLLEHKEGDVILATDERWHTDRQAIAAKRASARHLIDALKIIKQGSADLAEHSHSLKSKALQASLDSDTAQLQALLPQIQKAF